MEKSKSIMIRMQRYARFLCRELFTDFCNIFDTLFSLQTFATFWDTLFNNKTVLPVPCSGKDGTYRTLFSRDIQSESHCSQYRSSDP